VWQTIGGEEPSQLQNFIRGGVKGREGHEISTKKMKEEERKKGKEADLSPQEEWGGAVLLLHQGNLHTKLNAKKCRKRLWRLILRGGVTGSLLRGQAIGGGERQA